ncbi:MAG TPA: LuxR C-terminal-related transcriptional regulator [Bryobacteraceae bacterium]|jgi:DNA-binding CsgD family transcriptional regulator
MAIGQIALPDAHQAFEILGECRELWADPREWRRHLLRRLAELTHCRVAFCLELADEGGRIGDHLLSAEDVGWETGRERRILVEGLTEVPLSFSLLWNAFASALTSRRELTALQPALIDQRRWQASEMYDRYIRPTRIGEGLMSAIRIERSETWDHWCICNDRGDPPPGPRERQLVALIHEQIARMYGRELTTWRDRSLKGLTPRRREVLRLLLDGRPEKEIAWAMGRTQPAIHEHIEYLYRHFGVNSRAQLAAYFLRRRAVRDLSRKPPLASTRAWLARKAVFTPATTAATF